MFYFKKIISFSLIVTLLICTSSNATVDFTPQNETEVKYHQLSEEITTMNSKLASLDIEIEQLASKLNENNANIENIQAQIENNNKLIDINKKDIVETQAKIDTRIRSIYKSNFSTNLLVFLISSENISDLFFRLESMMKIISIDKLMIEEINTKQQQLENTINELKSNENELLTLKTSIESDIQLVNDKRAEQQIIADNLNQEKEKVFAIIEENEKALVAHPISLIHDDNSSNATIQEAINTLSSLIPQLNSEYVISLAQEAIDYGNILLSSMSDPTPPVIDTSTGIATYTMESTAYTGGGLTATGLKPVRIPDGISTVAVDPNVIPLGSKVYVSGYGLAIASDTGGAIKGNKIDVYLNTYEDCISWGRRSVTVTLLAYPGEW